MVKVEMKNCNLILTEKQQISALSWSKIDKYEFLTAKEILPSDQSRITEQAKFTYPPLVKAFEKQTETVEEQGKKQIDAIKNQNKRLEALTNKDDYHERFDEITELTNEMNQNEYIILKVNLLERDLMSSIMP